MRRLEKFKKHKIGGGGVLIIWIRLVNLPKIRICPLTPYNYALETMHGNFVT